VDAVRLPNGRETTREIVEHNDCVAVIALDADGRVLLVKQFRKAVGRELLEIPAGGIAPGESPEEAVSREMREETGYLPRRIEQLGGFYSAPGYATEYLYLYLATELIPSQLFAEDTEGISLVRVAPEEVPGLINSGSICDAKSIAGLLTYLEYRQAP
jgi:ADP-ribose pyrophosphatase